jgi:hypothetical protein
MFWVDRLFVRKRTYTTWGSTPARPPCASAIGSQFIPSAPQNTGSTPLHGPPELLG